MNKDAKRLDINKESSNIRVCVGAGSFKRVDYQNYQEWVETQSQFMDIYSLFKELPALNFVENDSVDRILLTLKRFIELTNDKGFAVYGYHYADHINKFKPGAFPKQTFNDHYFCFLTNNPVVLFITNSSQGAGQALHESANNIQISNVLHEELKDIIQVNVVIHNERDKSRRPCGVNTLYVKEDIFLDLNRFDYWYKNDFADIIRKLNRNTTLSTLSADISANIKKEMITNEALINNSLPSFCSSPDDQMEELQKLVLLSPAQYEALHSNKKHIILRGSYGSGKSLVLLKMFEKRLTCTCNDDIFYLVCGDHQSNYEQSMNLIKERYPQKLIVASNAKQLAYYSDETPSLVNILNHIKKVWKLRRTVHVFIDEFNASYIDKEEVLKLQEILHDFENSYIVITVQSMEEKLVDGSRDSDNDADLGYQFDFLEEQTSFSIFSLGYGLRSSTEINNFVKATSCILESFQVTSDHSVYFRTTSNIVDKEIGRDNHYSYHDENTTTKFSFNQNLVNGHTVTCGPVNVYYCDIELCENSYYREKFYITSLKFICGEEDCESDRYVISTYDDNLYAVANYFLKENFNGYTNDINNFLGEKINYRILLTDYASVRGFEFTNFIFMLPMEKRFLKYRMIECFTRATTKLHVIVDNFAESEDMVDVCLINEWKKLDTVNFYECKFDATMDQLHLLLCGDTKYCEDNVSKMSLGYSGRSYMRVEPRKNKDKGSWDNSFHDNKASTNFILLQDDVTIFYEFMKINESDIEPYVFSGVLFDQIRYDKCGKNMLTELLRIYESHFSSDDDAYKKQPCECNDNIRKFLEASPILVDAIQNRDIETVKFLLKKEGVSEVNEENMALKNTRFSISVDGKNIDCLKLFLLHSQVDVNVKVGYDFIPLHYALKNWQTAVLELLLAHPRIDVNMKDNEGQTPLFLAVQSNHQDVVRLLLSHSELDVNVKSPKGETLLHYAACRCSGNVIRLLLSLDQIDINIKNNEGSTPLHCAVYCGNTRNAKVLLLNKADMHIKDNNNETPYDIAIKLNHVRVIDLFKNYKIFEFEKEL